MRCGGVGGGQTFTTCGRPDSYYMRRSAEVPRAAVRLLAWKSLIWCFFERALAMGRWSKIWRHPFLRSLFVHVRATARAHFPHRSGTSDAGCEKLIQRYVRVSGLWRG